MGKFLDTMGQVANIGGTLLDIGTAIWQKNRNPIKEMVQNAKAAGIHPLAALGINPASGPQVGAFTNMGQNINSAISNDKVLTRKLINAQINETDAKASYWKAKANEPIAGQPVTNTSNTGPGYVFGSRDQNAPGLPITTPQLMASHSIGQQKGVHPLTLSNVDYRYRVWDTYNQQAQESMNEGPFITQVKINLVELADYVRGIGSWINPKISPNTIKYLKEKRRPAPPGYEYRYDVLFGGFVLAEKRGESRLFNHPKLNTALRRSFNLLNYRGKHKNKSRPSNKEYKLWDY